jgi:hypothetical protein
VRRSGRQVGLGVVSSLDWVYDVGSMLTVEGIDMFIEYTYQTFNKKMVEVGCVLGWPWTLKVAPVSSTKGSSRAWRDCESIQGFHLARRIRWVKVGILVVASC